MKITQIKLSKYPNLFIQKWEVVKDNSWSGGSYNNYKSINPTKGLIKIFWVELYFNLDTNTSFYVTKKIWRQDIGKHETTYKIKNFILFRKFEIMDCSVPFYKVETNYRLF